MELKWKELVYLPEKYLPERDLPATEVLTVTLTAIADRCVCLLFLAIVQQFRDISTSITLLILMNFGVLFAEARTACRTEDNKKQQHACQLLTVMLLLLI